MSYALTVLNTHFIPASVPTKYWDAFETSVMSDDQKKMIEWVSAAYGGANIICAHPALICSTDDTTIFAHQGKDTQWRK